jgi:hypothetical protein
MHFDEPPVEDFSYGVMMAVNYHTAHSEGLHKIVVQSPANHKIGQWELWIPPDSNNLTFYRREPYGELHPFEKTPANPEKVRNYFLHIGDPDEAMRSFKTEGFEFVDQSLAPEDYRSLAALSAKSLEWQDPLAKK